jgi:hypothetical protein
VKKDLISMILRDLELCYKGVCNVKVDLDPKDMM